MNKLVLIRHGQSVWNKKNLFTGWVDVDLTEKGVDEAHAAAKSLKEAGFTFDIAFTSVLKRANRTLEIILQDMGLQNIEVQKSWKLNERHYGALQGFNKAETAEKYGEEQVKKWRRGYDVPIPPLSKDSDMCPSKDPLYCMIKDCDLPLSESLKDVVNRVVPYWNEDIIPQLKNNKKIIIAASGNSLRALIKYLDNMTEEEIIEFNMPTGIPLVYEMDENQKPIKKYFLASEEALKESVQTVLNQGKVAKS